MTNVEKVLIENVQENEFVSDLLKGLEQALRSETSSIEVQKKIQENAKGEIITAIVVGLATNLIYDYLKSILKMDKQREDYNVNITIKIEGKEYSLEEIEKK
ncbi:hypothetical protein P4493_18625 [Bacillus thuringiensis]|uniref:Uncharacterized protein n=3 Tax=Bacillus thuringiensis TaxID=1428 RepID=A0AB35PEB1_BACTU|nr:MULTISPECIES: hypothetical protein [Bacillus]EAO52937.1 hypothetical protein RBTH_03959 [Bacillus thuringiensis serovar israelensis ATCC 35646]MED1155722.1 hypothetical protein [Bacillus paranthracis]AFQ29340.1 hypothetical protein BTF1_25890 [Bacillus thuringiensis HD-789]AJH06541.1 hypothetical protein AS86_4025 [Bacillus thuringiensis HD1002]AND27325.1 hypothetical protein ATN07_28305 [Bacillus thuringiensis serovar israelensis]